MTPHEVTGMGPAVDVLQRVGGVLLPPDAAQALAFALIGTVAPYLQADMLADIADDLHDAARGYAAAQDFGPAAALLAQSFALDNASHQIREALNR